MEEIRGVPKPPDLEGPGIYHHLGRLRLHPHKLDLRMSFLKQIMQVDRRDFTSRLPELLSQPIARPRSPQLSQIHADVCINAQTICERMPGLDGIFLKPLDLDINSLDHSPGTCINRSKERTERSLLNPTRTFPGDRSRIGDRSLTETGPCSRGWGHLVDVATVVPSW